MRHRVVAPRIVDIMRHLGACGCVDIYDITEQVLAVVVISTIVDKAQDAAVCTVVVDDFCAVRAFFPQDARTVYLHYTTPCPRCQAKENPSDRGRRGTFLFLSDVKY